MSFEKKAYQLYKANTDMDGFRYYANLKRSELKFKEGIIVFKKERDVSKSFKKFLRRLGLA